MLLMTHNIHDNYKIIYLSIIYFEFFIIFNSHILEYDHMFEHIKYINSSQLWRITILNIYYLTYYFVLY